MTSIVDAALRVKRDPSQLIDPDVVARACAFTNHTWRDRVFDPVRTLELFAMQIAHGNTAISHLVRLSGDEFSESAYCQARQRLPVDVVRATVRASTDRLLGDARASAGTWKGHRTFLTDGTGCSTPDTLDLRTHFGQASPRPAWCAFPTACVLTLFDAASGLLLDTALSPYRTGELIRMPQMHRHLRKGDLLVGDRIFGSYAHFAVLHSLGVHGLFRSHQGRTIMYPAATGPRERNRYNRHYRKTPLLVELIGPQDQVIELVKQSNRDTWLTPDRYALVPSKMRVRVLKFRVHEKSFRSREIELMTTLLDATKYPAEDLAALYLARWQIEVNLRHLKRTLGMTSLHCRTVEGVTKELLMYALVYNAVCAVKMEAAVRQGVPVERVSFIDTLRWMCCRQSAEDLPALKVNPKRSGRMYGRFVKGGSSFQRLEVPRDVWKRRMLEKYHPN